LLVAHDLVGRKGSFRSFNVSLTPQSNRPDQKDHPESAYSDADSRSDQEIESPKDHILLRLQVFIGGLILVVGFKIFSNSVTKDNIGVLAVFDYFVCGLITICFGILLISGIGLMYSFPML
jgi:hypothetical protein